LKGRVSQYIGFKLPLLAIHQATEISGAERIDANSFAVDMGTPLALEAGHYRLFCELSDGVQLLQPPRLYVDNGIGFNEGTAQTLIFSNSGRRGSVATVTFAKAVKALKLVLPPRTNSFPITRMRLRRMTRYEHYARLLISLARSSRSDARGKVRGSSLWWAVGILAARGPKGLAFDLRRTFNLDFRGHHVGDYHAWIEAFDTLAPDRLQQMQTEVASFGRRPLISVIMPVYNTPKTLLREAIESVRKQVYENWELCIADDFSSEPHVRQTLREYEGIDSRVKVRYRRNNGHISAASNSALELATGDWVAFVDHDDVLAQHALYWIAKTIDRAPHVMIIYSDEDKIDLDGRRFDPHFKPDWNPSLILSQNMVNHLAVYHRSLSLSVGGFRSEFDGSQDYDLILRCSELIAPNQIEHIARVLYHWRASPSSTAGRNVAAKNYARPAAKRAIEEALGRRGIKGAVFSNVHGYYNIEYELPRPAPTVEILIPTTCKLGLLKRCLDSLLKTTTYSNYAILLLVSEASYEISEQRLFLEKICQDPRVRVHTYSNRPFNFSWVNNWGASLTRAPILVFMNDDTEVITPQWLDRLVARVMLPGVAAAGAMLYYPNNTIQHAGVILGSGGVANHAFRHLPRGDGGYFARAAIDQDLSCVTAGCMAIRREVFEAVGGFDERLAIAFNDVDLCMRITQAGCRIVWTPLAELYHRESASLGSHTSPQRADRFKMETEFMLHHWGDGLLMDPAYNPNLSIQGGRMFQLSFPPRL
jgi:GT2 family glycosyltransferase